MQLPSDINQDGGYMLSDHKIFLLDFKHRLKVNSVSVNIELRFLSCIDLIP